MVRDGLQEEVAFEQRERVGRPPRGELLTLSIVVLIPFV